jgi:hypothetical protein
MMFFLQNMQNKPKNPQGDKKQIKKCGGQNSLRGEGYSESQ